MSMGANVSPIVYQFLRVCHFLLYYIILSITRELKYRLER